MQLFAHLVKTRVHPSPYRSATWMPAPARSTSARVRAPLPWISSRSMTVSPAVAPEAGISVRAVLTATGSNMVGGSGPPNTALLATNNKSKGCRRMSPPDTSEWADPGDASSEGGPGTAAREAGTGRLPPSDRHRHFPPQRPGGGPGHAQHPQTTGPEAGGRSPDSPGGRGLPSVGAFPYPGAQWVSLPGRKASDTETKPSLDLTYRCGGSAGLATGDRAPASRLTRT